MDKLKNALEDLQKTIDSHHELLQPADRESFDVWQKSSEDISADMAIVIEELNKAKSK
jgi:hypothetical protein